MTAWPKLLHPLLARFGVRRVWAAGLTRLKYPPTWCNTGLELIAITHHLETDRGTV